MLAYIAYMDPMGDGRFMKNDKVGLQQSYDGI
jgi:hypothetical protein